MRGGAGGAWRGDPAWDLPRRVPSEWVGEITGGSEEANIKRGVTTTHTDSPPTVTVLIPRDLNLVFSDIRPSLATRGPVGGSRRASIHQFPFEGNRCRGGTIFLRGNFLGRVKTPFLQ